MSLVIFGLIFGSVEIGVNSGLRMGGCIRIL